MLWGGFRESRVRALNVPDNCWPRTRKAADRRFFSVRHLIQLAFQVGDDGFAFLGVLRGVDQLLAQGLKLLGQGFTLRGQAALFRPRLLQFLLGAFQRLGIVLGCCWAEDRCTWQQDGQTQDGENQKQGSDKGAAAGPRSRHAQSPGHSNPRGGVLATRHRYSAAAWLECGRSISETPVISAGCSTAIKFNKVGAKSASRPDRIFRTCFSPTRMTGTRFMVCAVCA